MIRLLSGVTGIFRAMSLTAYLTLAIAVLALSLILTVAECSVRGEEIKTLEREALDHLAWQEEAQVRIAEAEAREGVSASQAALLCQSAGNSAFDRGVAFGEAKGRMQCESF